MRRLGALAFVLAATLPGAASGNGQQAQVHLRLVASGLDSPVFAGAPRAQRGWLYVVERPGVIRVLVNGRLRAQPFLDIHRLVGSSGEEQGLLSLAFHPRYARNHRFYVDYTDVNGDTRVVAYRSNGSVALPSSARRLLFVRQPYENHNGGQLQFGPDGRLYVGMGDGGSGGDPENRAQNLGSRLGKLLRLNVDRQGARWQVAGYGTPAEQGVLNNYGWRVWEGRSRYTPGQRLNRRGRPVFPVSVYSHDNGNCSVTGGYVYRGKDVPAARGRYFYGDYCSGTIWSLRAVKAKLRSNRRESIRVPSLSSFGEDAVGELYAVSLDGQIYQLSR